MTDLAQVPARAEQDWHEEWVHALEVMELDVAQAERLLREGDVLELVPDAWTPPDIGPLPAELHDRAHGLLDRQLRVSHELTRKMFDTRQQALVTTRLASTYPADRPAFVDRSG